jgi:hypothetical protein
VTIAAGLQAADGASSSQSLSFPIQTREPSEN